MSRRLAWDYGKGNALTWEVIDAREDRALLLLAEDRLIRKKYNMMPGACHMGNMLPAEMAEQGFL